jgi:hypothetical protein
MNTSSHEWVTGLDAWLAFAQEHPELGYQSGKWGFHNFLRRYRDVLVSIDAIRLAKGRFWVAHLTRFSQGAFNCATGKPAAASMLGQPAQHGKDENA